MSRLRDRFDAPVVRARVLDYFAARWCRRNPMRNGLELLRRLIAPPGAEQRPIRWSVVVLATALVALCLSVGVRRVRVDSDLVSSIPRGSPVLDSGRALLGKHPIVDRIAIDLSLRDGAAVPERLVAAADQVVSALGATGLFASVGTADLSEALGVLIGSAVDRMPMLFSERQLESEVLPRLVESRLRDAIRQNYADLNDWTSLGQSGLIAKDPLRLRDLVALRLGATIPKRDVRLEGRYLVSGDGRHLFISAVPHRTAGDPERSRLIANALNRVAKRLIETSAAEGSSPVILTAAGAYRAAMDNEQIVKRDTGRAVWWVTIAVSLLLLTCFSRPVLGILTLLPATAGVAIALLVYSLFSRTMSALSLGFGAALISITVDQGIVYVSYLDRVAGASGKVASRETRSAVSLATLTTVGAFAALQLSGYRVLAELGVFAALGSAFSFVCVHTLFPLVFRAVPVAGRRSILPVDRWLRSLASGRAWPRAVAGVVLLAGFGALATRPRFEADLNRLNTVTQETKAAELRIRSSWGDQFSRVHLLVAGAEVEDLRARADELSSDLEREHAAGRILRYLSPSDLWPGPELSDRNAAAWLRFWTPERRERVLGIIGTEASALGFAPDAFETFARTLTEADPVSVPIPKEAYSLLGIARSRDGRGWVWLGSVERGPAYDARGFARRLGERGVEVFDGKAFGRSLNEVLGRTFERMLKIVAPFVLLAVVVSFVHPALVALVLFPVTLGLVGTLGSLRLLGHAIDIPGLLVSVIVLGMGTNFSVYLVRAHQRIVARDHPGHDSVRVAALLDGGATLLGMTVLLGAEHAAARSAGLTGLLGIGFSLAAALGLLPPLLGAWVRVGGPWTASDAEDFRRLVWLRYRFLEPRPLVSAWLRLRFDAALGRLVDEVGHADTILVYGAGFGVEAVALAARPRRSLVALDTDPDRVRVAAIALGERGSAFAGVPSGHTALEGPFEVVVVPEAARTLGAAELAALFDRAAPGARLMIRVGRRDTRALGRSLSDSGFEVRAEPAVGAWLIAERPRS